MIIIKHDFVFKFVKCFCNNFSWWYLQHRSIRILWIKTGTKHNQFNNWVSDQSGDRSALLTTGTKKYQFNNSVTDRYIMCDVAT